MAIKRLRDLMTSPSRLRYLMWRARAAQSPLTVKLKTKEKLILRQGATDDLGIAYEVFVGEAYKLPLSLQPQSVRRVVDVGSNVGYTCLYWLTNYPQAQVTAFEPHPVHVDLIRSHLELNKLSGKVRLHSSAAGTRKGHVYLEDNGCRSTTSEARAANTITVPQVDWFAEIGVEPIDILKIDIEGGEYALLGDERFASLHIKYTVLEWHHTPAQSQGGKWCLSRLEQLGYSTLFASAPDAGQGMLWAYKL